MTPPHCILGVSVQTTSGRHPHVDLSSRTQKNTHQLQNSNDRPIRSIVLFSRPPEIVVFLLVSLQNPSNKTKPGTNKKRHNRRLFKTTKTSKVPTQKKTESPVGVPLSPKKKVEKMEETEERKTRPGKRKNTRTVEKNLIGLACCWCSHTRRSKISRQDPLRSSAPSLASVLGSGAPFIAPGAIAGKTWRVDSICEGGVSSRRA